MKQEIGLTSNNMGSPFEEPILFAHISNISISLYYC